MRTISPDARLYVQDICVNIDQTEILNNISLVAKSGEILAVMGPTGSGKTTLLNAIAGRQKYQSGSITLNGENFNKRLRRKMAFVQQQDVFFSQLTLKETLMFTAHLRMSDKITEAERQSAIDDIVDRLHIKDCLNTAIGDVFVKGLSGGEKKRASIACELLIDPDILILDEPTSSLDSSTAFDIMASLEMYARDFNKMIIVTIHQPASRIFHMCNNVLLLVQGHIGYFGSVDGALPYFESMDLHCDVHYNPADFLLEAVTSDAETITKIKAKGSTIKFRIKSQRSLGTKESNGKLTTQHKYISFNDIDSNGRENKEEHTVNLEDDFASVNDMVNKWQTSWFTQYRVLTGRGLKQSFRVIKQGYSLAATLIVSLICCFLYIRMGVSLETSRDVYGLIFFFGGYWTYLPPFEMLAVFPSMRIVINKERASGAYRLSALYCALMTSDLPNTFLFPTIMYILFFWVGGFGGVLIFFSTLACFLLHTWASYGLGLFISALCPDIRMAITVLYSYLLSMYLLGGFFFQNIPRSMAWITYLSMFFYPYASSIHIISEQIPDTLCNETSVVTFPKCADNSTMVVTSDDILQNVNVVFPQYFYILMIVFYSVALRIAGYLTLRYRLSPPV